MSDKRRKFINLSGAAKERLQFGLFAALLVLPVLMYISAQTGQEGWIGILLGLLAVAMLLVVVLR